MARWLKLNACIVLIAMVLASCTHHNKREKLTLGDNLFALKNLDGTAMLKNLHFDSLGNAYLDSTMKTRFTKLTEAQKQVLLPGIDFFDTSYVRYADAHFISKQDAIGSFTPIILLINADDYSAIQYVLLDSSFHPVAHYLLHGGECAGPASDDGKIMEYCPEKQAVIHGKDIHSYVLHIFVSDDTTSSPARIDSVNFISNVLPTGNIETRRIDSVSYKRMIGCGEFRDL